MSIPSLADIAIAHDGDKWFVQIDYRYPSQFGSNHYIRLNHYAPDKLIDILNTLAEQGLVPMGGRGRIR